MGMILLSARRDELEVWCDDDLCNPLRSTKKSSFVCWSRRVRTSSKVSTELFTPCSLLDGNTSFALSLRAWICDAPNFPAPQKLQPCLLSRVSPQPTRIRGTLLVRLSHQIGGALTGLSKKSDDVRPLRRTERSVLQMRFSESSFVRCFPICQEILNISQIAIAFHRISPPFFIQARLQQTADVPSFILRTALSAIPCVSDRWCVDVPWFHDTSSQDLPHVK